MIMSDSVDKPYIGDVLRKINPDAEIVNKEKTLRYFNGF